MGKIIINVRILQDPSHVGILLIRVNRGMQVISIQDSLEPTQNHVCAMQLWYSSTLYSCDLNLSLSRDYPSIMGRSPFVMCPIHPMPLCCLFSISPLVQYHQVYLNRSVIPNFALFTLKDQNQIDIQRDTKEFVLIHLYKSRTIYIETTSVLVAIYLQI